MARTPQHDKPLPPLLSELSRPRTRPAGPLLCALRGAAAAGAGFCALAVLVTLLWVGSPYPDSGLGGAFHVAASLWLLGHGAGLVRTDTLSGAPVPVDVVPLLLLAGPLWLVFRAARGAAERSAESPRGGSAAWWGVALGYLLVGAGLVAYARGGALRPGWPGSAVRPPLLVLGAALAGAWRGYGARGTRRRLWRVLPGRVTSPGATGARRWAAAVARAGAAGTLALLGGGAVVAGLSLVWHGEPARASFTQLTAGLSGRFAVLLLAAALVPNAAVWAAAYALGPGFPLGAGHIVAPFGVDAAPPLPPFPLLAAVPEGASPVGFAAVAVPVVAGATVAWFVVTGVRGARRALLALPAAALCCGVCVAVLASLAGGPLGASVLADFGPVWWQTGGAAFGWVVAVGTLGAAVALVPWATAGAALRRVPRMPRVRLPWRGEPVRQRRREPAVEPYDFLSEPGFLPDPGDEPGAPFGPGTGAGAGPGPSTGTGTGTGRGTGAGTGLGGSAASLAPGAAGATGGPGATGAAGTRDRAAGPPSGAPAEPPAGPGQSTAADRRDEGAAATGAEQPPAAGPPEPDGSQEQDAASDEGPSAAS
ncbi:DUF6350 family protein [Streptomyces sp. NPDC050560]|uniref:cell division protein PerM n=1 Tax=Streptomyces sp. NPDC050560 TaxID=3365630 RepID=UPI00378D0B77